ncbi:aminomethyltransferase (glycine cleavage system protein T) [Candidatus Hydrogenisulfobacillus filiaventi]|uniref:Aminomethyltransferase n=1 Tax=Candidatus Hydrogenisulfobacillus filiaventi TaxID=2707344 RepID=A0A6F8ZGX6_9FIRM|nr:glycine cleavage system aminomethyltransferase GcvT [Bacillota bacterium]CAB1128925.1 aminomethyltransferase (glycine cleavage system protein T) [Candidatus Hydrogenisulfobacillus filiaventi]
MKRTPLYTWHRDHGARLTAFAGYEMPVDYGSILEEHRAVRTGVGVFDVSHMGEFLLEGPAAGAYLDWLVTNRPQGLAVGQALYTPMCYPSGGTVDDLLVYRLAPARFMLVVNAANREKDWAWLEQTLRTFREVHAPADPGQPEDISDATALLAVQGPQALALLTPLTDADLAGLGSYHAVLGARVAGVPVTAISRTGYTGEDGFEIYVEAGGAEPIWEAVVAAGARPAGLGARDTLRLEARLPLYGHELDEDITPVEAGLTPFVKFEAKPAFIGRSRLWEQRQDPGHRRLVGLAPQGAIARSGAAVGLGERVVGRVTSGTHSPTLGHPIALALVEAEAAALGTPLWVEVRGRRVPAPVVPTPFYRRPR